VTGDIDTLQLTESYRYDGEQTLSIPYTARTDLGGAILVKCPDGSTRVFGKEEVVDSDE